MRVKEVKYLGDYRLGLLFRTGEKREVDLRPYVGDGEVFIPLIDLEYFKKVRIDDSELTICWPNGADFCPDILWKISKASSQGIEIKSN